MSRNHIRVLVNDEFHTGYTPLSCNVNSEQFIKEFNTFYENLMNTMGYYFIHELNPTMLSSLHFPYKKAIDVCQNIKYTKRFNVKFQRVCKSRKKKIETIKEVIEFDLIRKD